MNQVKATLDHLFRRESGKIVAHLTRFFGPGHLDLAEAVVQEALVKAMQSWPVQGIPDNPGGWILRAAKNSAIDHIRKSRDFPHETEILEALANDGATDYGDGVEARLSEEFSDDQLKLMFVCCHPALPRESRIALTLKTLSGFGVAEIARAFLAKEETIAQRLVRAKQKIADLGLRYEVPEAAELAPRLEAVTDALYLLFNEGYLATSGESLLRRDLCEEAIYRATALAQHSVSRTPAVHALLALMHFQLSRFNARTDAAGEVLLLEEQDRSLWDRAHIEQGMRYLDLSAEGEDLTSFHLQAGIAFAHASAPSFEATNWLQILGYYDILLAREPSPIVALNRAVALAMVEGWDAGLAAIEKIRELPPLKSYYLLYAASAEMLRRKGEPAAAKLTYETALTLAGTEPEKRLIQKRIRMCAERTS